MSCYILAQQQIYACDQHIAKASYSYIAIATQLYIIISAGCDVVVKLKMLIMAI